MTLCFPNPSRSFDAKRNRVRFWGYDNVIEISFFVEADVLQQLRPKMNSTEAGFLKAFDDARNRIYEVADRVYVRGRKGTYEHIWAAEDF